MKAKGSAPPPLPLRDAAEAKLARTRPNADATTTPTRSAESLVHELQVHQIELEMQNESLRQAQVELEASRDRYADLYEFAPIGYLTLSREARIEAINLTGATLLGEARSKLLNRPFAHFVAIDDQDQWQQYFRQALGRGGKQTGELKLRRHDGTLFAAGLDGLCSETGTEKPTLRIALTDITEHRQTVAQLHAANEQLQGFSAEQAIHLCELAGELACAEQSERDRLYELLHDEVQPMLIAIRLSLSSLGARTPRQECLQVAADACTNISQAIRVARTLSQELSPPLIREQGLNAALDWLRGWVQNNHGLEVDLVSAPNTEPEDVAVRLLCFAAVRELLMNIAKHAGTKNVTLTLQKTDNDQLQISVIDQGCGFDPATVTDGSGLAGIERRLGMFGGSLQIDSQPGHGTAAVICAPLRTLASARQRERRTRKGERDAQDTDRR